MDLCKKGQTEIDVRKYGLVFRERIGHGLGEELPLSLEHVFVQVVDSYHVLEPGGER